MTNYIVTITSEFDEREFKKVTDNIQDAINLSIEKFTNSIDKGDTIKTITISFDME